MYVLYVFECIFLNIFKEDIKNHPYLINRAMATTTTRAHSGPDTRYRQSSFFRGHSSPWKPHRGSASGGRPFSHWI